jgi:CBS domain-containing protein
MATRMDFSQLVNLPVLTQGGERVGSIADAVVRLVDGSHPQLTGILLRLGRRDVFVAATNLAELSATGAQLTTPRLDLRAFERRPGEVLLARDVLGRAVIDVDRARLVRVRDIALEGEAATWQVVGIVSSVPRTIRQAVRPWGRRSSPRGEEIPWTRIEPLVGHVPTARRKLPLRRLARLRPADIADIVEHASHDEAEEILTAVQADRALEADVFEELTLDKQIEYLQARTNEEVATVLSNMHPGDAVDLLMQLDQNRRKPVLDTLPAGEQAKIRVLLGYGDQTAGGLMGSDVFAVSEEEVVQNVLDRIQTFPEDPYLLTMVYALEGERLSGAISVVELLRAPSASRLRDVVDREPVALYPHADIPSVAMEMAHYNLTALPIVDDDYRLVGVVTYDDLIEAILPNEWRWRGRAERAYRTDVESSEGRGRGEPLPVSSDGENGHLP